MIRPRGETGDLTGAIILALDIDSSYGATPHPRTFDTPGTASLNTFGRAYIGVCANATCGTITDTSRMSGTLVGVDVPPVPLPAAGALLAGAMAGLAGLTRRRRRG